MNNPHCSIISKCEKDRESTVADIMFTGDFQNVCGRYFYLDGMFCINTDGLTANKAHLYLIRSCQIFDGLNKALSLAADLLTTAKNDSDGSNN